MIETHQQHDRHRGKLIAEPGVHLGYTSSSKPLPSLLHRTTPVAAGLLGTPRTWLPVRSHYYDLTFSAECLLLRFCNVFTAAIKTGARTQEPLYIKSINNNGRLALFKLHKVNCRIPLCGMTPYVVSWNTQDAVHLVCRILDTFSSLTFPFFSIVPLFFLQSHEVKSLPVI